MPLPAVLGLCIVPMLLAAFACGGRSSLGDYTGGIGLPGGEDRAVNDSGLERDAGSTGDGSDGAGSDGDAGTDAGSGGDGSIGAPVGSPCKSAATCAGGSDALCLTTVGAGGFELSFPGGYCTVTGCANDADCPEGNSCLSGLPGTQACLRACTKDGDCRAGYSCTNLGFLGGGSASYCLPPFGLGGG